MPTYATPEPITATIRLALGSLRILASETTVTAVELRPGDADNADDVRAARQTRVECAGGKLKIKGPRPRNPEGNGLVDAVLEVPAGSRLEIWAATLDLRAEGHYGDVMCRAVSGDIRVDSTDTLDLDTATAEVTITRAVGRTSVRVGAGGVHLHEVGGPATVKSGSGDVRVGEVSGGLFLHVASGNIALSAAHGDVNARAGSGNVTVAALTGGSLVAETSTGRVDVGIDDGVAAWLDLHSRTGDVRSSLPTTVTPQQGEETVKVEARTISGDILIHRA